MEPDNLSLADAVKIALQVESALECSSMLNTTEGVHDQQMPTQHVTQQMPAMDTSTGADGTMLQMVRQRPRVGGRKNCGNCGSFSHVARAPDCPARGQTCRNCGKLNHFAKFCRSAIYQATSQSNHMWTAKSTNASADISNVLSTNASFKTCTVQLGEVGIPLLVDTGAAASLLNYTTYKMFFSHLPAAQNFSNRLGHKLTILQL